MGQNSCTCLKKPQNRSKLSSTSNQTFESNLSTSRNKPEASILENFSKQPNENTKASASEAKKRISLKLEERLERGQSETGIRINRESKPLVSLMKSAEEKEEQKRIKDEKDLDVSQEISEQENQRIKMSIGKNKWMEQTEEHKENSEKEIMKFSISRNIEGPTFGGLDGPKLDLIRAYPAGSVINKKAKVSSSDFTFANPFSSHQTYRYANISDFQRGTGVSTLPSAISLQELPP